MRRRNLICFIFLTLFLFPFLVFPGPLGALPDGAGQSINDYISTSSAPSGPPILPEGPTWDGSEYLYEGLGQVLNAQEYSHGQNASLQVSDLDNGETVWGQIEIPQGWTGYQLTASVYNLFDNVSHIYGSTRNGNFESGTTSPDNWVESQRGMSGAGLVGLSWNYGTNYGETDKGINVWANCSGYNWVSNETYIEYIGWTQTIDLNRIDVTSATLSFDVRFYDDNYHGRDDDDEMAIYVEVGGAERIFVCHRYALNAYRSGYWGFHPIEFSLSVDDLQGWTTDTIDVTIGMTVDFDWTINNYFGMDFDNVRLIVRGKPYPDDPGVQLQLNSTSTWDSGSLDYGIGTISLEDTWGPYVSNTYISVNWTTASGGSKDVDFQYTLTLYIKRSGTSESQTGPEGTNFAVRHGESAYWTAWFFAPFYATYFKNYNFTLTKPTSETWTLYRATDPNLQDQTAAVNAASNSTHWRLPPSTVTGFGWWNFTFTSTNQIASVTGVGSTYYIDPRSPSTLSFTVNFATVTAGDVNWTIYDSDKNIVDDLDYSFSGTSTIAFYVDFNNGDPWLAGTYSLCVSYDNGDTPTQTAAGFYSAQFDIEHDTQLTPEQSPLSVSYGDGTEYFYPRVSYEDIDRLGNPFIDNSTGTVTVTGQVSGYPTIEFEQTGSLYQAIVPNNYTPPGDHNLVVTANNPYYEPAQTIITLEVRSDTTLTSPESPGLSIPYDESFTVQVFYADAIGQGIAGATVTTPGWTGPAISGNGTDGWYDITRDTSLKPSPGTYPLTVQAVDPAAYHETQTLILSINARRISTTLDYSPPGSVPWGDDVVILLDFAANDPESTTHDGDDITSASFALQLDGAPLTLTTDYTIVNHTDGTYTITLLASSGKITTIKSYNLAVQATPSNAIYGATSRIISFQIGGHQTQTIVIQPDPTPYGFSTTGITVQWSDLNGTSLNPYPGFFDSLEVHNATDMSLIATRTSLVFDLDTSTWLPGTYDLTVIIFPDTSLYLGSTGSLRIIITVHQTAVTILPPEPTPWGETTNITIQWVDLTAGGYISISNVSQIIVTGDISDVINNPSSWTITLDTTGLTIAGSPYSITIEVHARTTPTRIYADSSSTFNELTIRGHRVYVLVTGPPPVPEDGSISISINWTDLDTGNPINPSFLSQVEVTQISGPSAPGLPDYFSTLDFVIDATGWARGIHRLNITVYSNDVRFQTGFGPVNIVIRVHSINADVDPIPRVPYGNDILIIFRVNDSDLVPPDGLPENHIATIVITGGPSTITLDSTNWFLWVNNGTAGDGIYEITLDVSSWGLGTYFLQFNVYTSAEYGNGVVNTQLTVRSLATSFTYQSPPVVPWGEDGKLIVTYLVDDPTANQDGNPITGATISIAGLSQGVDFDFIYWQAGKYNITFYSSYLTSVQSYNFDITITSAAQYENRQLDAVPLSVRALFTWLHPTDVPITPFGDNVTIDIEYIVLDGESLLNGQPIHTESESITVTGLDGFNPLSVSWEWIEALSVYRITINASDVTLIQAYRIMISISGSGSGYEPDTIPSLTFNVRTVFTAMAVAPVDAQAYLENFTIQITYTVNDPDSSLNGLGIDGQASIMELVGYSGLYHVYPLGYGVYNIVINSTSIGGPGSYLVTINTDWTQSPPPYAIQTRQVTLFVTERPTTIRNTIAGEFGYLDDIRVNFTYSDELRLEWILNTSYGGGHIFITLYNSTPAIPVVIPNEAWYIVAIMGSDAFQIRIDADYFGIVNVYFDFKVEVTWRPATVPYFEAQEFEFRAYVVGQRTDVIIQPSAGATPYDTNIIIEFQFVTELGETINETDWPAIDVSLLCQQVPSFGLQGTDWDYTFLGDGFYEIWVDSTRLAGIGSYTFFVNVTYPGGLTPFFESQYNEPATRLVRYINTLLEYIDPGSLYSGDDLNLTIRYWNLDNSSAVPNSPEITFIVTSEQSRRSLGGGWWEFMIDTSGLPAGAEFDIYAYANQFYYIFQNISVPVYIFEVPLEITLKMPTSGVINRHYGETPFPIVIITLQIGAGSDLGNYVTDASVIGYWDHGTLPFTNELNGTYWIEISSLFDKGAYFIEINASKVGYFSDDIRIISYTITAGPSQLATYLCGPTSGVGVLPSVDEGTSFILYANQLYFIGVWFRTLAGDNITGAIVTYSSAFQEIGENGTGPLPEVLPGIYGEWFNSSDYGKLLYSMEVLADTAARNVQSQRLQFQLDVRYTPAKMQPENDIYFISVEYFENFTIIIYLNDTLDNLPIPGQNIIATWGGGSAPLDPMTGGYYNCTFPATLAAGFTYELYLDFNGPGSFDCPRATLTIQITPRQTSPVDQMDIVSVRGEWNNTINILQVPVGDWLYIYLNYTDADGVPIRDADGLVRVGDVSVSGAFYFDASKGLYVAMLNASFFGRGIHSLRVTISRANFESKSYTTNFEVIRIPTEISVTEINGIPVTEPGSAYFYLGSAIAIRLFLNDTWHNEGIDNAVLSLPTELLQAGFEIVPLGDGFYEVRGTWGTFSLASTSIAFTLTAEKTEPLTHDTARLTDWVLTFVPPFTLLLAVYGGAGAAVTLIFVLISWLLWVRVFSIPWEVRRMRSLAKTVEKEEGYTLSGKDRKHFHDREITLKDKVTTAMSTVGVAATPAMIPAIEGVEEVTATEEDIMTELDKIPGLGPEEKAVLADEMRKIPRKDRIWFLDDLRRQMGQRRMDFLTMREPPPVEPTPKPVEEPKVKPKAKPKEEPSVPLEKVKPKEPPAPDKALTEDRTAPTVLPPELEPAPVPKGVEAEIRRELDKIPGLSTEEKEALVDHLKYLSKEERQATYNSLKQSANEE